MARTLRVRWAVAMLFILSLGLIASATLTPSREALRFGALGTGTCDLSRIGIASLADLALGDPAFNILLYVPLGLAIGLFPASRLKAALIVAAIVLPFAIETIQMVAVVLDRACQSADISDNLTGLVIGLVVGILVEPGDRTGRRHRGPRGRFLRRPARTPSAKSRDRCGRNAIDPRRSQATCGKVAATHHQIGLSTYCIVTFFSSIRPCSLTVAVRPTSSGLGLIRRHTRLDASPGGTRLGGHGSMVGSGTTGSPVGTGDGRRSCVRARWIR